LNAPFEVEKRTLQIENPKIPIANTSAKKGPCSPKGSK
jgi:hypothetical protein